MENMMHNRLVIKQLVAALAIAGMGPLAAAAAAAESSRISDDVVKIGVLTDLSGVYSDLAGNGSVIAARLAVEATAGTARALVKEGKKSWYFITADYTFGQSLEKDASEVILANGGQVLGNSRHPFPGNDFSAFLLKAQSSKADVIALANAGNDTINAVKQAREYGISNKQTIAPLL